MEINNSNNAQSKSLSQTSTSIFLTQQKTYINSIFNKYDANEDGVISIEDGTTDDPSLLGKNEDTFSQRFAPKSKEEGNTIVEESIITDPNTCGFLSQDSVQEDKKTGQIIQTKTTTPSEIPGFSNYQIKNGEGEVTDSVNFSQDENGQHEEINMTTSDGGKFIKNITNNGNQKSMKTTITDAEGKILYDVSREYERTDTTASVTVNGQKYTVEGLDTDKLTLTSPDGTKQEVDLNKYCSKKLLNTPNPEEDKLDEKEEQATPEEQEKLKNAFKNLPPDAMIKYLNKAPNGFGLMVDFDPRGKDIQDRDGTFDDKRGMIWITGNNDADLALHELTHAVDGTKADADTNEFDISGNNEFKQLFQKAKSGKFMTETSASERKYSAHVTDTPDELLADSYSIVQDMDLKQPDIRHLILMKYFAPAMAEGNALLE